MHHFYQDEKFGENWFGYEQYYTFLVNRFSSPATIVEVGSWKGKSIAFLGVEVINSKKDIKLYAVDTWLGSGSIHEQDVYIKNNKLYELFLDNIAPLNNVITPLRMPSVEAAKLFQDESIDAVFIDGNHDYEYVRADIDAWYPKVKRGGIISGHDYDGRPTTGHPGVRRAVHESFPVEKIIVFPANCWVYFK